MDTDKPISFEKVREEWLNLFDFEEIRKKWMNSFNPETATIAQHWQKLAYDFLADRNKARKEAAQYLDCFKEANDAIYKLHTKNVRLTNDIARMQGRIHDLLESHAKTIELAARYEAKLDDIHNEYPGILGIEELTELKTTRY